jgi:Fur family ferric uptake transcriptional regulator
VTARNTRQRAAVRTALSATPDFTTAQELHRALRARGESIGLATVYRALARMAETGEIDVIMGPGGESLYRACSVHHHHHLVCRSCGLAIEVEGPPVETWAADVASRHGFSEVTHTVEIFGECPDCRARRS